MHQRLGACAAVVEATEHCLFGADAQRGNPFWGIFLQTAWQYLSGRHLTAGDATDPRGPINAESWWAANNYFLSVVPYLVAAELGMVEDVRPAPLANAHGAVYPRSVAECALFGPATCTVFDRWRAYLEAVRDSRAAWCGQGSPARTPSSAAAERDEVDRLAGLLWVAHQAALRTTTGVVDRLRLERFAPLEQRFAYMWAMSVAEGLAEMQLVVDYPLTVKMQELVVPWRMLRGEDDTLADLAPASRAVVRALTGAHHISEWVPLADAMNRVVAFGMCSPAQRRRGGDVLLHAIEHMEHPAVTAPKFVAVLLGAVADPACPVSARASAIAAAVGAASIVALLFSMRPRGPR